MALQTEEDALSSKDAPEWQVGLQLAQPKLAIASISQFSH
jgi:hypothetical protein